MKETFRLIAADHWRDFMDDVNLHANQGWKPMFETFVHEHWAVHPKLVGGFFGPREGSYPNNHSRLFIWMVLKNEEVK